jgi:hypothetical protein
MSRLWFYMPDMRNNMSLVSLGTADESAHKRGQKCRSGIFVIVSAVYFICKDWETDIKSSVSPLNFVISEDAIQ